MRPLPSRLAVVLATVLMLLAALSPLVAAPHEDNEDNPGDDADDNSSSGPGSGDDTASDDDDGDDDDGPPDFAPARRAGVGRISSDGSHLTGAYIALDLTSEGFSNFTYQGVAVLDRVAVAGLAVEEVRVRGADVRIEGAAGDADVEFRLHDTPTAVSRLEADEGADLRLTLADGISATLRDDGDDDGDRRTLELSGDGFQGVLWSEEGDLEVNGSEVTVAGEAKLMFMAARGPMVSDERMAAIGQGVADAAPHGRIGAEVRAFQADGAFQSQAVTLTDMTVLATQRGANVMVVVSSDNETGRTVVLHLDKELYPGKGEADLTVQFDGENISRAADLADVLEPADDDGEAEYVLVVGADEIQVLVSVPGFSVHTVEVAAVQGLDAIIPQGLSATQIAAALGAAAVTVGLAAAVAGKRRR